MTSKVQAIPEGYHSVTPYLITANAADAIAFYKQAFGAIERMRMAGTNGKICHAELQIGNSVIMLADEMPERGARSPQAIGGSPISLHVYVTDVDSVVAKASAAGAKIIRPVADQFYGDRSGMLQDPFGHVWNIATHVENVSPEEMHQRFSALQSA